MDSIRKCEGKRGRNEEGWRSSETEKRLRRRENMAGLDKQWGNDSSSVSMLCPL